MTWAELFARAADRAAADGDRAVTEDDVRAALARRRDD